MSGRRLLVVVPILREPAIEQAVAREIACADLGDFQVDVRFLPRGTASIEGAYDESVNTPYILSEVGRAQEEGYRAVVIDCFAGPGVRAAREMVDIPVMDPGEAAMHLGSILGGRFGVINILPETEPVVRELVRRHGLEANFAGMFTVNVPVLDLDASFDRVVEAAIEGSAHLVTRCGAGAIVLGCTGMMGMAERVTAGLRERGLQVPVIDPFLAALHLAAVLVRLGLSHSKVSYPPLRPKRRVLDET